MENPLVSVLISSFNHVNYATAAIESVIRQTYDNIELIVIDDGSTDGTTALLKDLSEQYGFSFSARENKGFTATLNELVKMCHGKYISILASDDFLMLDKIEKQVLFLEENPRYGVCGGNFITINEIGEVTKKQKFRPARDLNFEDIFLDLKPGIAAGSAMIRKEILPTPAYDPTIEIEDLFQWLKITEKGIPIHVLNDIVFFYRKHSSNMHKDIERIHKNVIRIYDHFCDNELHSECVEKFNIQIALRSAKMGQKRFARRILSETSFSKVSAKIIRTYYHAYKLW